MSLWDVDWDTREDENQLPGGVVGKVYDQNTADLIRDMFDSAEQIRSSTFDTGGVDTSWMNSGMTNFADQPGENENVPLGGIDLSWASPAMGEWETPTSEPGWAQEERRAGNYLNSPYKIESQVGKRGPGFIEKYIPYQVADASSAWTGQRGPGREVQEVPGGWGASPMQEEERLSNSDALAWLRKYQNVTERDMVRRPYYFPNTQKSAATGTKANSGASSGLGSGYYGGGSRSYGGGGGGGYSGGGGGGGYEYKVPSWYIGAANWRFQK